MVNENKHSILAPSSKEWVHCGYSAKFLATKEEETNEASEFGTECHALAEASINIRANYLKCFQNAQIFYSHIY